MKPVFFPDYPGRGVYIIPGAALLIALMSLFMGDWIGVAVGLALLLPSILLSLWLKSAGDYVDDEAICQGYCIRKKRIRWDQIERIKLSYCRIHLAGRGDEGRRRQFLVGIHAGKMRSKTDFEKVDLLGRYLAPDFEFDSEAVLSGKELASQTPSDVVPASIIERRVHWRIYSYGLIALWLAGATWMFLHLSDFENEKAMRKILMLSPIAAVFALTLPQGLWRKGREDRLARIYGYERLGWQIRRGDSGENDSQAG